MSRAVANRTFVAVIFAMLAAASPAVAQHKSVDTPFPGFERTDRDLGTWDAVLTGHDRVGRFMHMRYVETTTSGCGGACFLTRFVETSTPMASISTPGPWWTALPMGPGIGVLSSDLENSAHFDSLTTFAAAPVVGIVATSKGPKAILVDPSQARISVDYPSSVRRVVTVRSQTGSGADVQLLRISYTRREPIPAPSR
jgi:hypothetical protein